MLYAAFNQEYSCFSIGTEYGFSISDVDPMKERFKREFDGGIGIIELLFKCNILALVGGGKKPKFPKTKVMIWDDFQAQCIAELEFKTHVKGVRLRRDRVFAILENKVFVYNFENLKLLDQVETYSNPTGICAVCPTRDHNIIAVLGEREGQVRVIDYTTNQKLLIEAHTNAISQMTISMDGTKLATTSARGTLVRIFDIATGKKIQELRRGANPAVIHCLAFNKSGSMLCLSSDKGTIHIFSCSNNEINNKKSTFAFMSPVVPLLGSSWSSKQFSVDEAQSICAFGEEDGNKTNIIVLGSSGRYHKYSFTPETECTQEGQLDYFLPSK
uniref:Uncharacterized protein n=1 Tax=Arcella intermedia TaxID=1963864 RepID=A0A6B2L9N4_9EUKA